MTLGTEPSTRASAKDHNNQTANFGVTDPGGDVVTQRMVPNATNPEVGAAEVFIRGAASAAVPTFSLVSHALFSVGMTVGTLCALSITPTAYSNIELVSTDGSLIEGNTAMIWIGDATVAVGGPGVPIRPGQSLSLPCGDLSTLHAISVAAGQKLAAVIVQ